MAFLLTTFPQGDPVVVADDVPPSPAPRVDPKSKTTDKPSQPPMPALPKGSSQPKRAPSIRKSATKAAPPKTPKPTTAPKPSPEIMKPAKKAAKKPVIKSYTDPLEAGPAFKTQGEYTGRVTVDGLEEWYGVQVIALGDDEFEAVIYRGGLPGNDWDREAPSRHQTESTKSGYHFDWGNGYARIRTKSITVRDSDKQQIGELTKVRRSSRTLRLQPPQGAVILFDGLSVEQLEGGQLDDDHLLKQGFTSKETFGSFSLHAEFRTPFMPTARGQGRGNSGIYLQGRYETQILDSFGLEGLSNEAGGIYDISEPDVNMCFPPLSWQTYDVEFTAAQFDKEGKKTNDARMTVKLNGVVVQDDVAAPRTTRASKLEEGPQPGPLYVQDHGNPVRFRNLWIVRKDDFLRLPPPLVTMPADDSDRPRVTEDWATLFDGQTLAGWHKNPEKLGHGTGGHWFVKDGALVGEQDPPGSGNGGILLTDETYGDFELSIDMKPDWGVCSGLFLRGTNTGKCFQMLVDYHDKGNVGHFYGEGTGGFTNRPFSIFGELDRDGELSSLRTESTENTFDGYSITGQKWAQAWKVGEWNTAVVRVVGQPPVMTTWINGVKVSELDAATFKHPKYDAEQVAESLGAKGHIAVQVHGGKGWPEGAVCRWRNIKVNPLD